MVISIGGFVVYYAYKFILWVKIIASIRLHQGVA